MLASVSFVERHHRFAGNRYLNLECRGSPVLALLWGSSQHVPPKRWYLSNHYVTNNKTLILPSWWPVSTLSWRQVWHYGLDCQGREFESRSGWFRLHCEGTSHEWPLSRLKNHEMRLPATRKCEKLKRSVASTRVLQCAGLIQLCSRAAFWARLTVVIVYANTLSLLTFFWYDALIYVLLRRKIPQDS